jgi:HPt (histidine-containing phosphotransfer) domain-containing protein
MEPIKETDKCVVDPGRMQDLVDSLGDGLRDVIESYLDDAPVQIEGLRVAFEHGDRDALQEIAHSLKSSSGIFGARQMVEACRTLEVGAREDAMAVKDLLSDIAEAYERVRDVLNLYLQEG